MFLNVSTKSIIRICFYLIIIAACITSLIKFLSEPTTFEEKIVYNQARLPSFTLCPTYGQISDSSIGSFEDIEKAIENVRNLYTIEYKEFKAYEEFQMVKNKSNDTFGVSYFVPKIDSWSPFETVICFIWTPSRNYQLKPDWSFSVSYFSIKVIH